MAAQVLSGSGNVSYTNSTGQNVRVVINYLETTGPGQGANLSFQGVTVLLPYGYVGKTIPMDRTLDNVRGIPTEFALSNGETFSVINPTGSEKIAGYNFIIIPEAG